MIYLGALLMTLGMASFCVAVKCILANYAIHRQLEQDDF